MDPFSSFSVNYILHRDNDINKADEVNHDTVRKIDKMLYSGDK